MPPGSDYELLSPLCSGSFPLVIRGHPVSGIKLEPPVCKACALFHGAIFLLILSHLHPVALGGVHGPYLSVLMESFYSVLRRYPYVVL